MVVPEELKADASTRELVLFYQTKMGMHVTFMVEPLVTHEMLCDAFTDEELGQLGYTPVKKISLSVGHLNRFGTSARRSGTHVRRINRI
jgi:hypothetical protein